jgi:hypothetical protein
MRNRVTKGMVRKYDDVKETGKAIMKSGRVSCEV